MAEAGTIRTKSFDDIGRQARELLRANRESWQNGQTNYFVARRRQDRILEIGRRYQANIATRLTGSPTGMNASQGDTQYENYFRLRNRRIRRNDYM